MTDNPLLEPSDAPFGMPDYTRISFEHYLPAFDAAIAEHGAQVDAITSNVEPATFENTLVALERAGRTLDHVQRALFIVASADAGPEIQDIRRQVAPKLAAHSNSILLNTALFARVDEVFQQRGTLSGEDLRLVEKTHERMLHAGVALADDSRRRLTDIGTELSELTTKFQTRLLADTNDAAVVFDDEHDLDGLAPEEIASASRAADERGLQGSYLLPLRLFTSQPALAALRSPESRRTLFEASITRGRRGRDTDTGETLLAIVRLRAERAAILGYDNAADALLALQVAGTAEAAQGLLRQLAPAAARNARAEETARAETLGSPGDPVHPADWAYATEVVRERKYSIDLEGLRPWFELERVLRDGVFFAASRLYGLSFVERDDIASYHPEVRAFDVFEESGEQLGLFLLDPYSRPTKRGGAWMNALVTQSRLWGTRPVVTNTLNLTHPAAGDPTLLTLDEVTTLFHEFGHALHGLFSNVTYPSFSGTNVPRDFVEFPSQVNEMWILWPEVLENYARHIDTDEPLPDEVVQALTESATFNEGFATSEYLASAWLDQAWHSLSSDEAARVSDVQAFERSALADIGLDNPAVPPRYASTYFQHIFTDGYAAGYYSYIWSEVLDADTVAWFREHGGLARDNGQRFRDRLLSVGGAVDPASAYRDFRGRDPEIEPLLERRGLR